MTLEFDNALTFTSDNGVQHVILKRKKENIVIKMDKVIEYSEENDTLMTSEEAQRYLRDVDYDFMRFVDFLEFGKKSKQFSTDGKEHLARSLERVMSESKW